MTCRPVFARRCRLAAYKKNSTGTAAVGYGWLRRRVFASHLSDVFDNQAPGGMAGGFLVQDTPGLAWLVLTKRPSLSLDGPELVGQRAGERLVRRNRRCGMTDMLDALDWKRGKGPQVVRVERVVAMRVAKAIVGNVQPAAASKVGG